MFHINKILLDKKHLIMINKLARYKYKPNLMMRLNKRIVFFKNCLFAFSIAFTISIHAEHKAFYQRSAQGWFWYEIVEDIDDVDDVLKANDLNLNQSVNAISQQSTPMSVVWLRDNIQRFMDRAIDEPTIENIKTYLYMQKAMMDKSSKFADMSQLAVIGDPYLDESLRRPTATFAVQTLDRQAYTSKVQLLSKIATQTGIFFFFRSDCPFCHKQAPILERLAEQFNFSILAISIDGAPLATGAFKDFKVDQGQAQILNIQAVPALFLMGQAELTPLSQGILSYEELIDRIILNAYQENLISKLEYESTQPFSNPHLNEIASFYFDEITEQFKPVSALTQTEYNR